MSLATIAGHAIRMITTAQLRPSPFSLSVYGAPEGETEGLYESIAAEGVLVPLVVVRAGETWEVISGHRRLACARELGIETLPCQVRSIPAGAARQRAVLDYNRQRTKRFSQLMREADALEAIVAAEARKRQRANLRQNRFVDEGTVTERRNSDARPGRTDSLVARVLGLGGKDVYRQARAVWRTAQTGDARAQAAVSALDAGAKTIHAAHKDLRRRDRFTTGFRPTPYDVWPFRHDRAFGVAHPGSIPPAIIAHTLHYFTEPNALVVDPMAGGGTALDVCAAMGRRCLAYDLAPVRSDVRKHNVNDGLPAEAHDCDLVFCDPPYHTMLAHRWPGEPENGSGALSLPAWQAFLERLAANVFAALRPGGHVALLLANQTEKDLPAGHGYIDHAFLGYAALTSKGFLPVRRISCPMDGAYLPQHVTRARAEGRMLGQVRDLLVMRKPA